MSLAEKLLCLILFIAPCHTSSAAPADGAVEGTVRGTANAAGLPGVEVAVSRFGELDFLSASTDADGTFRFLGLTSGSYDLRFAKDGYRGRIVRSVRVASGRVTVVAVELPTKTSVPLQPLIVNWKGEPAAPWDISHGSVFDRTRIASLPSPRNIWALLENQDPASVTNRVDVGGIATGSIALAGPQGASWTRIGYRSDGIDVTDPFETGRPLVYPDFGGLQEFRISTGNQPAGTAPSSSTLSLTTRRGGSGPRGEVEAYYLGEPFQSDGSDSDWSGHDFVNAPRFGRLSEGQFVGGGPVPRIRASSFFVSLGIQRLRKEVPGFQALPTASVKSGLLRFDGIVGARDELTALVSGQIVNISHIGARPGVTPSATLRGYDRFSVIQGHWTRRCDSRSVFHVRFGFSHASPTDTFHADVNEPNRTRLFTGEMSGAAPIESDSARSRFSLVTLGEILRRGRFSGWNHWVTFGLDLQRSMSTEERRIFGDVRLLFYPLDDPIQVIRYNTPSRTKQRLSEISLFLDDRIRISEHLSFRLGATANFSRASLPAQLSDAGRFVPERKLTGAGGVASWISLSPQVGIVTTMARRYGGPRLSAGFSRYYHRLPARYANFANSTSVGGEIFEWTDPNGDGDYEEGEEGTLLRAFGGPYSFVDSRLRRPFTDEWTVGLDQSFRGPLRLSLRFFRRDHRNLAEDVNTGVPRSSYRPLEIHDSGDDDIPGTGDDRVLTVFEQDPETLGKDNFILTNPGLRSTNNGLEAFLSLGFAGRGFLQLSFTAFKAVGEASPGNSELENDNGIIGTLYDDPNTLVNARGRLFFDRAYIGKVAGLYLAPWKLRFGSVIKYFDGLPFGRRLIVTGLHQGPFFVMATPRGQPGGFRTQYNLTFDQRIAREFEIGWARLSVMVDIFNLLDLRKHLREYDISGPLFPLRLPTDVQNPRVVRFGVRLEL